MIFKHSKIAFALIFIALLIFACTVGALAENLLGDADVDGSVTIMDATYIQKYVSDVPFEGDFSEANADVDKSGELEITDATFIQRWIAGDGTPYPIGALPTEPATQPSTQRPTDADGWGRDIFQP